MCIGAVTWKGIEYFDSSPHLDRQYSAFGKVIKGMEFIDKIKKGDPNSGAVPNPDKIISLRSK